MSREIKFRAMIVSGNGPWIATQGNYPEIAIAGLFLLKCGDQEVMQFTGLHDKNGVEIYEGDIVKAWSGDFWMQADKSDTSASDLEVFYVKRSDKELRFRCDHDNKGAGWYPRVENDPGRLLFEVIGNVHENPDLLA
ncbi:YopX family protein [Rathayibacter festucae]|uniref:YopX family protein n=1 Tax=Rathayibacter festucae TaxID=110937 RepID=UPI001FB26731|nr:YopX family protein [Rathayibacter festucae]MCJ1699937.1 YopX family protein [Rathayibacter festucae]